jgi:hypothetical protein
MLTFAFDCSLSRCLLLDRFPAGLEPLNPFPVVGVVVYSNHAVGVEEGEPFSLSTCLREQLSL